MLERVLGVVKEQDFVGFIEIPVSAAAVLTTGEVLTNHPGRDLVVWIRVRSSLRLV